MRKRTFLWALLLIMALPVVGQNDPILSVLTEEMKRNYEIMSKQPDPVYYLGYRVNESKTYSKSFENGGLRSEEKPDDFSRLFTVDMRIGSYEYDNTREIRSQMNRDYNSSYFYQSFPKEFDPYLWKERLWAATNKIYQNRTTDFSKVKAEKGVATEAEDKSDDFSKEKREQYYEPEIDITKYQADFEEMEKRVQPLFALLKSNRDLLNTTISYGVNLNRNYQVDNEGVSIVQNNLLFQIAITGQTIADDGMELSLYEIYRGRSLQDMPSTEQLLADIKTMSQNLSALKKAPVADTYAGPAILSSRVTGVFFHEFFGHRIEGARLKEESDAQTFKKMRKQEVLPKDLSVTFDPQLKYFEGLPLIGDYVYDDEGIKGQRVEVVKNGILENFLMSRRPIEGFPKSNGHGRSMIYYSPVTRQSNMFIVSNAPKTEKELRQALIAELKKQKKPYGYHFIQVSGGSTITGRGMANAFNVYPLLVYRVWADESKPDELVRGVNLIGTPLSVFSQIIMSGKDYTVFNGYCGAESGSIPVSAVAPSMLLRQIETQRAQKNSMIPPILPKP